MALKTVLAMDRGLLGVGERVCVALSGGADSVALLLGLVEANGASAQGNRARRNSGPKGVAGGPLGVVLSAAHVHHGLRGAEADEDEAFVRELCQRLGVGLTVFRVDTAARQVEQGEGVEEAARELRYAALRGLMERGVVDVVATAHTLNDQAETVVMKMLRGAWTEGLAGISPVVEGGGGREKRISTPSGGSVPGGVPGGRPSPVGAEAQRKDGNLHAIHAKDNEQAKANNSSGESLLRGWRVVRPLLGVRRVEVEAFLRERGQGWREDATNRDLQLTRNRVRHVLMPLLREFNPGVDGLLARTAEVAREEEAFWRGEVERLLPQVLLPGRPVRGGGRAVSTALGESGYALEVERLRAMPAALRRRVVRAAARRAFAETSGESYGLNGGETAKMLALAGFGGIGVTVTGRVGSRLELHGGLRAERSAREIRLWKQG